MVVPRIQRQSAHAIHKGKQDEVQSGVVHVYAHVKHAAVTEGLQHGRDGRDVGTEVAPVALEGG